MGGVVVGVVVVVVVVVVVGELPGSSQGAPPGSSPRELPELIRSTFWEGAPPGSSKGAPPGSSQNVKIRRDLFNKTSLLGAPSPRPGRGSSQRDDLRQKFCLKSSPC